MTYVVVSACVAFPSLHGRPVRFEQGETFTLAGLLERTGDVARVRELLSAHQLHGRIRAEG